MEQAAAFVLAISSSISAITGIVAHLAMCRSDPHAPTTCDGAFPITVALYLYTHHRRVCFALLWPQSHNLHHHKPRVLRFVMGHNLHHHTPRVQQLVMGLRAMMMMNPAVFRVPCVRGVTSIQIPAHRHLPRLRLPRLHLPVTPAPMTIHCPRRGAISSTVRHVAQHGGVLLLPTSACTWKATVHAQPKLALT